MTALHHAPVDATDRRILLELTHSGRASMSDVAQRVHISRANAYARVRRLIDGGVIERFAAHVSPEGVGLGTSAYVSLSILQNSWRDVSEALQRVPGVEHVALCSGDMDVMVLVRTSDNASLRDLVLEEIRSIPGVLTTRTVIVLDEMRGAGVTAALENSLPGRMERRARAVL
jgi:DNA-binding Lrp family transcriptional regulator